MEMKKSLEGLKEQAEERISDPEDMTMEITKQEKGKKWLKKSEQNLRDLWDNIKKTNTHIVGFPKFDKRQQI